MPKGIELNSGWVLDELQDNPRLTEDERDALLHATPDEVNEALEDCANDHFWEVAYALRSDAIRLLVSRHQTKPVDLGDVKAPKYEPEWD